MVIADLITHCKRVMKIMAYYMQQPVISSPFIPLLKLRLFWPEDMKLGRNKEGKEVTK